jgi:hypothetical protein
LAGAGRAASAFRTVQRFPQESSTFRSNQQKGALLYPLSKC